MRIHSVSEDPGGLSGKQAVVREFATRLSLIAFATASLRGLMYGAEFQSTLEQALVALAGFYGLGLICGDLARRVVEENAQAEFTRSDAERGA